MIDFIAIIIVLQTYLQALPRLSCLNISWNYLTNYHENLGPLRKHCPSLEDLDTRHNCWSKVLILCILKESVPTALIQIVSVPPMGLIGSLCPQPSSK